MMGVGIPPSDWRKIKLKEICEITVGHVGPMASEYVESGIPFLRSQNVKPFSFDLSDIKFITQDFHKRLKKSALRHGDVVVVRTGYPGVASVIPKKFSEINCSDLVIIRKSPDINSFFLSCIFNSQWGQSTVSGNLVGAAQQHFNIGAAKEMTINLPPLPTQQKIAALLSAYDDLIENNTCRIKILEEMAQALYREWFVHFRFPGHESVRMVESELGLVPEGWEVRMLGDVCNLTMGQSPKSEYYNEIGEGLPFHQGVTNFGSRFPSDKIYCTMTNRIAEPGDILFSVRAPVGRINLANKKIVIGRGLSAIRSKNGNQLFTYHQLKEIFQEEDTIGGGTIFKSVTKEDMNNIKVLTPGSPLIKLFEDNVNPISSLLDNLITRNVNLRQTRDLLLPKLISGEMDVSVLDIRIPEAEV